MLNISKNRKLETASRKYRNLVISIVTLFIIILFFYTHKLKHRENFSESDLKQIQKAKDCYEPKISFVATKLLDDILKSPPKTEKNIFFTNTGCIKNGTVSLTSRDACAIESAAKWAPNHDIFVLFVSPVGLPSNDSISPRIRALLSHKNIHFRNLNLYEYAVNTPAEKWIKRDIILSSNFYMSHMSDFLRLESIYKYGGKYFDLDFIFQKSLENLPPNFAGAESSDSINSCAIGFQSKDIGHNMVEIILRENTENYKPHEWAYNGPGAITRAMQKICGKTKVDEFTPEICSGFKLYPIETFFPIGNDKWLDFFDFDSKVVNKTMAAVKNSIAVHMWNDHSATQKIKKSEPINAYKMIAEKNCPKIYSISDDSF